MKNKVLSVLLICMFVFALASCGSDSAGTGDVPTGMKPLSNDITDYVIYIPQDWTPDVSTGVVSAMAYDRTNVNVIEVTADEDVNSVDDFFADYEVQLKDMLKDYKLETDPVNTKLGGFDAKEYIYSGSIGGSVYKYRQVISLVNKSFAGITNDYRVYMITYTATEDLYDTHTEEVDKIINSFSFKD